MGSLGPGGAPGQVVPGLENPAQTSDPPRWRTPFEHDRRDPFLDLVDEPAAYLPRPIEKGVAHWRTYSRCPKHKRAGCHHHQHPELDQRLRGSGRGRPGKLSHRVTLAWKRSESAEHHARFGQWLWLHADLRTRYVGKPAPDGSIVPYSLEEIAEDLRRPGELALPLWILCEILNAFCAAENIHRHRARRCFCVEHQVEDCKTCERGGVLYWRSKVATLRITNLFIVRSGADGLRDQWLRKQERTQRRQELAASRSETRSYVANLAHGKTFEATAEKIRRRVMGEHPDWVLGGRTFAIDEEVDRQLQEHQRQREAARARRGKHWDRLAEKRARQQPPPDETS